MSLRKTESQIILKLNKTRVVQNSNGQDIQPMESTVNFHGQLNQQVNQGRVNENILQNKKYDQAQNLSKHSKTQILEDQESIQKKLKMPQSLKKTLIKRSKDSGKFNQESQIKKSKLGNLLTSKIKGIVSNCGICLSQMKQKQIIKIFDCEHLFCQNCLNQYVFYKVGMFQQIFCPQQECNMKISQGADFYKNLPIAIRQKYAKIHNFYKTANDRTLKLCPKQECDGVIKIIQGKPRICNKCQTQYCPKCYLKKHKGKCDNQQIDFLQNNLHFRQCPKCKFIVERTEGCNHITCRCKYQFCYVCGKKWRYNHRCSLASADVQQVCCDWTCFDDCGPFSCILKFPLKLILYVLFLSLFLLISVFKLIIFLLLLVFVILAGMFFFSISYICKLFEEQKNSLGCLMIILFPIAMVIGIGIAIKEVICDVMRDQMAQHCFTFTDGIAGIWSI